MGLDQYITIRHKSTNNSYKRWNDYWKMSKEERKGLREPSEPSKDLILGYFRKHNNIHKWFVNNIQNGVDDCGRYEVSLSKIKELKELCEKIMSFVTKETPAPKFIEDLNGIKCEVWQVDNYIITEEGLDFVKENLPTNDGFFFGSTVYDNDYFWTIENAINVLTQVITICELNYFRLYTDRETGVYTGEWVLEYSSSW